MDCLIPSHSVRTFSCAIGCLCRIGKELYIEYDPLDGLSLNTLNDAKSAFASFHFEPAFFERCSAPPTTNTKSHTKSHTVKNTPSRNKRNKRRKAGRAESETNGQNDDDVPSDKFTCRVPLRLIHSILRTRKGVRSLRIRTTGTIQSSPAINDHFIETDSSSQQTDQTTSSRQQLCFEFKCDTLGPIQITRRIGLEECDSVTALAPKDGCSEIIAAPKTLNKMLDPLCRTAEVALTVNDSIKVVTATSFHHSDALSATSSEGASFLMIGSNAYLKTETSMEVNEFDEYSWRDDRENNVHSDDEDIPGNVNDEVTLVFGIKEVKAMLQFCSQAVPDEDMNLVISFEWGGRPIIFETESDSFSARLIMATLNHRLLRGVTIVRNQTDADSSKK